VDQHAAQIGSRVVFALVTWYARSYADHCAASR
jgi:hypothetical protein